MTLPGGSLAGGEGEGNTRLDPDEAEGLIPNWIATRGDLDIAEFDNVRTGQEWSEKNYKRRDVLDVDFIAELHRRMFGRVWKWAGTFRRTEKSIGVDPLRIATDMRQLMDDVRYWDEHDTYPLDERAARLHHRLVTIHPFANGNGRLTREVADLYLRKHGAEPSTWGEGSDNARDDYLAALRAADQRDYAPLLRFVRS